MKHKLYTRLLSLALAVGLVIGMLPSAAAVDTVGGSAGQATNVETYTATTKDGVTVTATAVPGVIPEGAQLEAETLNTDSEAYTEAKAAIDGEDITYDGLAAFDIRFMLNGEEVEPNGDVQVSIDTQAVLPENADSSTVEIHHLKEDGEGQVQAVEALTLEEGSEAATFTVDSFSSFTITWTSGRRSTHVTVNCKETDDTDIPESPANISFSSGETVYFNNSNDQIAINGYTFVRAEAVVEGWWNDDTYTISNLSATYNYGWSFSSDAFDDETVTSVTLYYEENPSVEITDTIFTDGSLTAVLGDDIAAEGASYEWTWSTTENGAYAPVEDYVPTDESLNGVSGFEDGTNKLYVARAGARLWFKVKVTTAAGEIYESKAFQVKYYDALQNGSFETPTRSQVDRVYQLQFKRSYFMQIPNGINDLYWQTTAKGKHYGTQPDGYYIEIINSNPYPAYGISAAADGSQFAELNCETAGALYQDVLTTPGSTLYWGLEHASRNNNTSTMAVVISDTESLPSNWNPADESDLDDRPDDIQKRITSTQSIWTNYSGTYVVPEGQYVTRFYFVATNGATEGNLLDDITFGKDVPKPEEKKGNLTVQKVLNGANANQFPTNAFTFNVKNEHGESVGTISLPDGGNLWSGSLLNLDPGVYTISEEVQSVTGYTLTGTTYVVNNDAMQTGTVATVTIEPDSQNTVVFTNAYEKSDAQMIITKDFVNADGTPIDPPEGLEHIDLLIEQYYTGADGTEYYGDQMLDFDGKPLEHKAHLVTLRKAVVNGETVFQGALDQANYYTQFKVVDERMCSDSAHTPVSNAADWSSIFTFDRNYDTAVVDITVNNPNNQTVWNVNGTGFIAITFTGAVTVPEWKSKTILFMPFAPEDEASRQEIISALQKEDIIVDDIVSAEDSLFNNSGLFTAVFGDGGTVTLTFEATKVWSHFYYGGFVFNDVSITGSLTNTLNTKAKISIPVEKVWADDSGSKQSDVTVTLSNNGEVVDTVTLGQSNSWEGAFEDVPKYNADGTLITYTADDVQESKVEGYTASITGDMTAGFTITNTRDTGNLTITKQIQGDPYGDGRDMFSFRITCIDCADDTNIGKVWYVHINGEGSKTITLPVGKYEVEELGNMHYEFVKAEPAPEILTPTTRAIEYYGYNLIEDETITFTNEPVTSNIPSDGGGVENHFDKYEDGKIVWKPEEYGDDGEIQPKPTPEPSGE